MERVLEKARSHLPEGMPEDWVISAAPAFGEKGEPLFVTTITLSCESLNRYASALIEDAHLDDDVILRLTMFQLGKAVQDA